MAAALAEIGGLFILELLLDDEPIAISINLIEGDRLFGFKSAIDARHRSLSPGILNLAEVARALHEDLHLGSFDSGGNERSYVAPLLPDRHGVAEVLFTAPGRGAGLLLRTLPLARDLRRSARRLARSWADPFRRGAA